MNKVKITFRNGQILYFTTKTAIDARYIEKDKPITLGGKIWINTSEILAIEITEADND